MTQLKSKKTLYFTTYFSILEKEKIWKASKRQNKKTNKRLALKISYSYDQISSESIVFPKGNEILYLEKLCLSLFYQLTL